MNYQTIAAAAGVSAADVARIFRLSRVTTHAWFKGTCKPNRWIEPKVHNLFAALEAATLAGVLPLEHTPKDVAERLRTLADIVMQYRQRPNTTQELAHTAAVN